MRTSVRSLMFTVASCALVATTPAFAQSADGEESADAGEIVVTAQKREERLIDVPVSVSAVSADSLTQQNLVSIRDFYTRIPGIQLSGNTTQDISLRGINTGGGTNPTVSILIDDVQFGSSTYLGRPPIPDLDPATLERVEVLRGPQGTLYGASSLGGLIKYVTRDPDTNDFSGRIQAGVNTVEDGNTGYSVRGTVNLPIIKDRIAVSVSGFYRDDPRYVDSIIPAGTTVFDANKNEVYGGRAALRINVTDTLTATFAALYQRQNIEGSSAIPICSTCTTAAGSSVPVAFDPRGVPNLRTARSAVVPITNKLQLYTGRLNLDLDDIQVTSITAWGRSDQATASDVTNVFGGLFEGDLDGPGTTFPIFSSAGTYLLGQPIVTDKFSQELRMAGQRPAFDWLVGLFYTAEDSSLAQSVDRVAGASPLRLYTGDNISTYDEMAVFGDVTFHLTDKFDVQVGGRYATNKQTYDSVQTIAPQAAPIFGTDTIDRFKSDESAFTWLIAPTFKFTPDLMAYARVAKGYRPGGPNTNAIGASPSFGPDSVISYELGLKGAIFDNRLTFDVAVFEIDWKDIQLQNTALPSQFIFYENGKKARSRGLEASFTARPLTGLHIDGNMAILDAELTESLDRSTPTVQRLRGLAGDRLPYSAKFTANLGVQQDFQLSDSISAYAGFTVSHTGDRLSLFNQDAASAVVPRAKLPAYTTLDLRAGLNVDDHWSLDLYVRNVTDSNGVISVETRQGTRLPTAAFIRPRTYGLTASVKF